MSEHPNAVMYREAMERFNAGDYAAMDEGIADDVVWWQIGSDEPLRGKQALRESMALLDQVDISVDLTDVVANDDMVVGLVTATVGSGPDAFSYRTAEIAWLKDGKVTERRAYSDDTEAINKFFSQFG
ncbi:MAG TPA: nuclear transport factor 2 family protein [Acidimicrobiia bacterium]|nr:nuclear transport factor 2 family protein [Acidimicrobiia bacterium]